MRKMTPAGLRQMQSRRAARKTRLNIRYHVIVQRIQDGTIVLSEAEGHGDTLLEALAAARSRCKNMYRGISDLLLQVKEEEAGK